MSVLVNMEGVKSRVRAAERSCNSNICLNGGTCLVDEVQRNFRCVCPSGFAGSLCQEVCSLKCNEGHCVRGPTGSEHCACKPGFYGKQCEIQGDPTDVCTNDTDCETGFRCMDNGAGETVCTKDPCATAPCAPNAKCIVEQDDFRCECGTGFAGRLCDADINECELTPCKNGGTCINTEGSYECKCTDGLHGPFCEDLPSQCAPNPCNNAGQCVELLDGFKCLCQDGFDGPTCNVRTSTDPCSPSPCKNHGQCVAAGQSSSCLCTPEYTGATCSELAECSVDGHPCQNGGKCIQGLAVNTCQCDSGFNGKWCEVPGMRKWPNVCDGIVCQNGGSCDPISGSCTCKPGFSGSLCEKKTSTITSEPSTQNPDQYTLVQCAECVHSHSCLELETGSLCVCMKGYIGPTCFLTNQACKDIECDPSQQCLTTQSLNGTVEAACGCAVGRGGPKCQQDAATTFSAQSLYVYQSPSVMVGSSSGPLPYSLDLAVRSTVPDSHIATGENIFGQRLFSIFIRSGRLVANISGTAYYNMLPIGINDGTWVKIQLKKTANDFLIRVIEENGFEVLYKEVPRNAMFDVFTTRIGRISEYEYFTGCITDVVIDGNPVNIANSNRAVSVKPGCSRVPQCTDGACANEGTCVDLWSSFECKCKPPFLPPSCSNQLEGHTFGSEGMESRAVVLIDADNAKNLQATTDVQFLLKTNKLNGAMVFMGDSLQDDVGTFLSAGLEEGHVVVRSRAGGKNVMRLQAGKFVADNEPHVVRVERTNRHVVLYVDDELQAESDIPVRFDHPLFVEKAVIGSIKETNPDAFESAESFKGFMQDLQVNGHSIVLKGSPNFEVKTIGSTIIADNVLTGLVSDDVCQQTKPCAYGKCKNTFNDFKCECEPGWMGKKCNTKDHCSDKPCEEAATCINSQGGYLCTSPATFTNTSFIQYDLQLPKSVPQTIMNKLKFSLRTSSTDGWILQTSMPQYSVFIYGGRLALSSNGGSHTIRQPVNDGRWHDIQIQGNVAQIDGKKYGLPESVRFNGAVTVSSLRLGKSDDKPGFRGTIANMTIGDSLPLSFYRPEKSGNYSPQDTYWAAKAWNKVERQVFDSNVCLVSPCKNGGQCRDHVDKFMCDCPSGFTGERCEINENECDAKHCANGYCLDGLNSFQCVCDGKWSGTYCDAPYDFCKQKPCKNGGKCINTNGTYTCGCKDGWMGQNCDIVKTTSCKDKPCRNAGKCQQVEGSVVCECPKGFAGPLCDVYVSPCEERPCKNGVCKESGDSYVCECSAGYAGKHCNELLTACGSTSPCSRGRCEDVWNGTICHCDKGWQGGDCSVDINECLAVPCENDAECVNSDGAYQCKCRKYYLGDNCEVAGSCLSEPCKHGECVQVRHDEHQCKCHNGFEGANCDQQINYCKKSPCQNGGTCENLIGEYKCHCIPGFAGPDCEVDIDECASSPCQNHGGCKDRVADYECICDATGYNGKNCTEDIDECLVPSNCIHGMCTNAPGTYRCHCEEGFVGGRCSVKDPCIPDQNNKTLHNCVHGMCSNPGVKIESGRELATHECACYRGYSGPVCSVEMAERRLAVGYILGPLVAVLLVLCLLGCALFVFVLKGKRATHGHYSPSNQEMHGARLQMNSMIKLPPEERLI
ncbi:unnamed protein product, partial [Mesorhabditis spiculigera]